MLTRLIYYSSVGKIDGVKEIYDILDKSKVNNAKISVSGMLYFNEKYFLQVLEGDRKNVSELMLKIAKDERHSNIVIVDVSEIGERMFTKWNMVYAGGIKINNESLMQFSPDIDFNPDKLSTKNFEKLIQFFKEKLISENII